MKVTKKELINKVYKGLESLGFKEFKESKGDWHGLFIKKTENNLYLTLGIVRHRFFENRFTGVFYFSKTTTISAIWGDIPKEIYVRLGFLLSEEELDKYCNKEFNEPKVKDIWWDAGNFNDIEKFIKAVGITMNRVISNEDLLLKINFSEDIRLLAKYAESVKSRLSNGIAEEECAFTPSKEIDGVPLIWFQSAESVLKESSAVVNAHTVLRLAKDAFRQSQLGD